MITPGEIKSKALNYYFRFLKAWLSGNTFFPLDIPADKGRSTDPFMERKQGLEKLISQSKLKKSSGYILEIKEINTRKEGVQSIVNKITFDNETDFLAFIGKTEECEQFREAVNLIRSTIPALENWIADHINLVLGHLPIWPALLSVCAFFMQHPQPGLYIRELPVPVHTKFIEENRGVLRKLLDFLLPPDRINSECADFEKRFHLKQPEAFIRFRTLDPDISIAGFTELSIPVSGFIKIILPVKRIIIIENLMTYLTFPPYRNGIAVWGKGFGVEQLKNAHWLSDMEIFYWGDIDTSGFEILSALRGYFPHVFSIMMEMKTYTRFSEWAIAAAEFRRISGLNLTTEENRMYEYLLRHPEKNRLEQERITQDYVAEVMSKLESEGRITPPVSPV